MKYNQKVTADQGAKLINLWRDGDMVAVRKLQQAIGVDHKWTQRKAYTLGLTKDNPAGFNDPRWARAIAIGKVEA